MSLKVQLPLNGNLNNQGIINTTVTNNGASVNTSGKIGSCYSFNGTSSYLLGTNAPLNNNTTDWSFCCWVKVNSSHNGCLYSNRTNTSNNGITIFQYSGQFLFDDGTRWQFTPSTSISNNTWYHLAFTRQAGVDKKFYVNGVLTDSISTLGTPTTANPTHFIIGASQSGSTSVSGNLFNGYLNDVRVYDHALSAKEVKEISKGLVVHYPLNGNQSGLDNILINTADLSKQTKESGITCTYDSNKGIYKIEDTSHTSSRQGIYQDISVNPNTFYTLSCTLEGESCGIGFGFFNGTPTNFPSNVINVTSSDGQVRKTYSAQSTSTATYCRIYLFTNCGTSKIAYFKFPKLELGSIATPWIPNSTDTEYSAYGYNSLTELDISGYKNHGTKTKIMNIDVNTPRYNVCTIFDGTNDCILTPFNSVIKDNNYTISVQVKKSVIGTDYYQTIFGGPSGFELEARNGQTNEAKFVTQNQGKVSYAYNFNQQYHFVFVHSSSDSKLYIDGTLIGTGSTASIPSGNYYVGSWRDTTSQNFEGQMSDFRIYATALSADDIKELYSSSASIANNGTVMCYEFNEE